MKSMAESIFYKTNPDIILSVHSTASALAPYLKELSPTTPVITYITDWFGKFLHGWANISNDLIICQSHESKERLLDLSVPLQKIKLIDPVFAQENIDYEADNVDFGINKKLPTIILNRPSEKNLLDRVHSILETDIPMNIIVLGEKSKEIRHSVNNIKKPSNQNIIYIDWTDKFEKLMEIADQVRKIV